MASLQEFIDRGMAFFSGELVSKAELTAAKAELEKFESAAAACAKQIAELTAQLQQANDGRTAESNLLTTANQKVHLLETEKVAILAERDALKAQLADPAGTIQTEVAKKTAAAMAAHGVPAASVPGSQEPKKSFSELMTALDAIGDPKARAAFYADNIAPLFSRTPATP